jgi:hypothetical protein
MKGPLCSSFAVQPVFGGLFSAYLETRNNHKILESLRMFDWITSHQTFRAHASLRLVRSNLSPMCGRDNSRRGGQVARLKSTPANDDMRQRLEQGCVEDDQECSRTNPPFDALYHLANELSAGCDIVFDSSSTLSQPLFLSLSCGCADNSININCAPGLLVCAGGEFQMSFMLIAQRAARQIQPFLRLMAPGQTNQRQDVGDFAVDSAVDSWFDDRMDLQSCRLRL